MKQKVVFFVTLVLRVTTRKRIAGSNLEQKGQSITVYQKIQKKSIDARDAYNQTILEAQTKYEGISLIAHTTTELTTEIFDDLTDLVDGKVIKLDKPKERIAEEGDGL